jgi:hypothetical protein
VEKEQRRVTAEPIGGLRRGAAAVIGVSGIAAGALAVFQSDNQAGSVALLAIGAGACVVALVGKVPLRWVVAGAEVDMSYEESRETADTLSEFLNSEQLQMVTRRLLEGTLQQPASTNRLQLAATLSRASAVEAEGHGRMRRFATMTDGWSYQPANAEFGADGVMTAPGGTKIAVEFKAWGDHPSKQRRHHRAQLLSNRLHEILERTGCGALFVLTDETSTTDQLSEFPSVLRRPMRVATFADGYQFVLGKLEELRAAAVAGGPERATNSGS